MTDLRALSPLDEDSVLESLGETGLLVIVDESDPYCRRALEIAGLVVERGFDTLDPPVKRATSHHKPVPATPCLEALYDMCPVLSVLRQRWKRLCLIEPRKRSGKKMPILRDLVCRIGLMMATVASVPSGHAAPSTAGMPADDVVTEVVDGRALCQAHCAACHDG